MRYKKKGLFVAIILVLVMIIKWYATSSQRVEAGYSTGFYPVFARFLRMVFGWVPFSVGDVLYGLWGLWLLLKLIKGIKFFWQRKATWKGTGIRLLKALGLLMIIYIVFNLFWGINYNRQGIAKQLDLKADTISYDDLKQTTAMLIEKMNACKKYLINNKIAYPSTAELSKKVHQAYAGAKIQFPFLDYKTISLKTSMWGWLGNYTGFTGYYNPFTGEAQINTTVPKFLQPFIACHEVAHQLGYAKENEANSVGYIAALHSGDSLMLYSTYYDLYNYIRPQLYLQAFIKKDTALIKEYNERIIPEVKADIKEVAAFYKRHRNPIEPVVRKGYGLYLKNNNQPLGIKSYDAVTSFLIAYYKKFGKI